MSETDHQHDSEQNSGFPPAAADPLETTAWQVVFDSCRQGLRAFLRKRLNQDSDIDDCLQTVFLRAVESGRAIAPPARRAWLFRVAANESARFWRSQAATDRMLARQHRSEPDHVDPAARLVTHETRTTVQRMLTELPAKDQQIIRLRIEHELTFRQIADQLELPLGTVLTRMRRALQRLGDQLDRE